MVGSTSDPQSLNRYVYARDNPMKIVDMNGHEWWNPVADISSAVSDVAGELTNVGNAVSNAWNSLPPDAQVGIVVGAVAAATVGLCLTVVGCFAAPEIDAGIAAVGIGAAAESAPNIESEATSEIIPSLSRVGVSLTSIAKESPVRSLTGFAGEEYINIQTDDINNGMLAEKLGINSMAIITATGETIPDSLDHSFEGPPVGSYVRVGGYFSWTEFDKITAAVDSGAMRPGIIYALKSPFTGAMGPSKLMEKAFEYIGFSIAKIDGPWWRF